MEKFIIDIVDLYWIDGEKENPEDLCLHGEVNVTIGGETIAEKYDCTVSSTALYLLKSIKEDHLINNSCNQMLPCCGHFIIPNDNDTVEITGCDTGIDWDIIHQGNFVKLVTEDKKETLIDIDEYTKVVFDFADKIEAFYKSCKEKVLPKDDFDREGYIKFWKEWNNRRHM